MFMTASVLDLARPVSYVSLCKGIHVNQSFTFLQRIMLAFILAGRYFNC